MLCVRWQTGAEPKTVAATGRKVTLPESFDDWDDFDLNLSTTKAKPKPNDSFVTKPAVTNAVTVTTVNARKKSLFDDDDDDDIL